jgi:phage shock protein A
MAWWDDVLKMIKDEFAAVGTGPAEPSAVKQAQQLLERTAKELGHARGSAEAARRRALRNQREMEALSRDTSSPHYRERLAQLHRAVSADQDLAASFDAHIQQLATIEARVRAQLEKFNRDVEMARAAMAAKRATASVAPKAAPKPASGEKGFRRARPDRVLNALKDAPKRKGDDT